MAKKKKRGGRTATARKRKTTSRRKATRKTELIISKSRTKGSSKLNVSGEFYAALDTTVRHMIKQAEARATDNGRKTLRPYDL